MKRNHFIKDFFFSFYFGFPRSLYWLTNIDFRLPCTSRVSESTRHWNNLINKIIIIKIWKILFFINTNSFLLYNICNHNQHRISISTVTGSAKRRKLRKVMRKLVSLYCLDKQYKIKNKRKSIFIYSSTKPLT
jgi:hypothetical protein